MGWASGFRAGSDVARQAIDTYREAKQQRDFQKIAQAKPEESQGFTAEDGDQLTAIANAKRPDGTPYYSVETNPEGGYGVRSNFTLPGADGQQTQPGMVGMAPRTVTDFMGQRTVGTLDQRGIDNARTGAYADAISQQDPVRGMQMRRQMSQDAREDTRFEREGTKFEEDQRLAPMREQVAKNQLAGSNRTEATGVREDTMLKLDADAGKLTSAEIGVMAAQVNTNQTDLPLLFTGTTKGGYSFLTRDPKTGQPGGKPMTFNDAQMRDLARANLYNQQGFVREAQVLIRGVSKELAELVGINNETTAAVVRSGNDALKNQKGDENDAARLGIAREGNRISSANGAQQRRKPELMVNDKGETVIVDTNALPYGADGTSTLPQGLRVPGKPEETRVTSEGFIVRGNKVFAPDPKDPTKYKEVLTGPSRLDLALAGKLTEQEQAPGIPGRPMANVPGPDLMRLADRPRGVSPAEAADAMRELQFRKTNGQMSAF
jgi:hypothetical protein